ncbi:PPC domain-containing DNA-binding protein [Bosea vaviloviae]|uniref:DNA-binding protein with PD1-like DNA-binding motif n=1 Tax=Bosea vaviloviae TaxID=1526658 RepID=A0A0N1EXA3_9HYPH|nr:PPC domain-containing DNA-binding protein [Bosea vaviloviae]KPH73662.1 DNA-binding protein with PD1-like DNA-binding motif [Bosea vaviloviae]
MHNTLLAENDGKRVFAVVLDAGDEAFACISRFANDHAISAASITAIGAFQTATVGFFDIETKTYLDIPVDEQSEVLSLIGDIAEGDDGRASLHLHAVLGLRDGSTRGGHLLKATVRPTLEVIVTEMPGHLRRRKVEALGIALLKPR